MSGPVHLGEIHETSWRVSTCTEVTSRLFLRYKYAIQYYIGTTFCSVTTNFQLQQLKGIIDYRSRRKQLKKGEVNVIQAAAATLTSVNTILY